MQETIRGVLRLGTDDPLDRMPVELPTTASGAPPPTFEMTTERGVRLFGYAGVEVSEGGGRVHRYTPAGVASPPRRPRRL